MHHHTFRPLAAALAFALASGACVDAPTSPAARTAGTAHPGATLSPSGATLIPNSVRYRDRGGKPATGRSGSAALEAFALLGKDGRTTLEYRAVPADPEQWWVSGTMTRAQIRALDADSSPMFTYNENNIGSRMAVAEFGSLSRGQYLRVQANVTGIDPHRTDVVSATERVKLRPDLAVRLDMAPEVPASQPVPIQAVVTELNGDVGAQTQCALLVNGWVEDFAWGVWVDAGDAVSCAFTHTFAAGTYDVQVELTDVYPGDWDEANNRSDVVHIEAVGGPTEFNYYASASATRSKMLFQSDSRWHNATTQLRGEYHSEWGTTQESENAHMSGFLNRLVSGEVSVQVSQSTDGRVIHADSWTTTLPGCDSRSSDGASIYVCSYAFGSWADTWFSYSRDAGSVTYHSRSYSRVWDDVTGENLYYYHQNSSQNWGYGTLAGLGNSYAFRVRLTSGDLELTADSEFPLVQQAPYGYRYNWCGSYTAPWDGYTSEWCESIENKYELRRGSDSRYQ